MSQEKLSLFESVIRITEERDKRSLEKALVQTLSDFIDFETLVLLRVPRSVEGDYLEVAAFLSEAEIEDELELTPHDYGDPRARTDAFINQCIETAEITSEKYHNKHRTATPIVVNNTVSGILDLRGHDDTDNTNKLIQGFLRIFSNFQAIINDNEHDTLTGLLNRKTFESQLSELLSKPRLTKSKINNNPTIGGQERRSEKTDVFHWVGVLDIDHFKQINDNYGHIYGDEVLLHFANLMEQSFRNSDLLFRYGGEEFVVVLAPATEENALEIFNRFRKKLAAFDFPQVGHVTVSAGIIKIDAADRISTIIECADKALYFAKENGRNQVCDYHKSAISDR
jgi:diguanylate cyclase (GGDEF)-like protein